MDQHVFERARAAFLETGDVDAQLLELLRRVVSRLIRFGGLPPIYSPTGRWDADAEDEVLGDWIVDRLLAKGQLAALLHQAATPSSFARLGELYLRRHLINRLAPTQARNIYGRVREMLDRDSAFEPAETAGYWRLVDSSPPPFGGSEQALFRVAWGLGQFETIQFREDAKKLSHLLESSELHRFISGLLRESGYSLTLDQLMRVLVMRFNLEPYGFEPLESFEQLLPGPDPAAVEVVSAQTAAVAALTELSARQAEVLRLWLSDLTVRQIADELKVSIGTVSAEQRVISTTLGRISDSEGASRPLVLNALRDLLF